MTSTDYFDLEVDRIYHPQGPLPSGRVSIFELLILNCLSSIAGFITSTLLGLPVLALATLMWVVGISYNWRYKETGLPGNTMVAFCVVMTFLLGGMAVNETAKGLIWTFGLMAFVFDLIEEIASGAMDMEGNFKRSPRTVAIMHGKVTALRISSLLFHLLILISLVLFAVGWLDNIYLLVFVPMDLSLLYFSDKLLTRQKAEEGRKRIRQLHLSMAFLLSCSSL
jgi:geranylgeranylglycerol-phosphate geranylgeranyltransferase